VRVDPQWAGAAHTGRMTLVRAERLGTVPYHDAFAWQQARAGAVREGHEPEVVGLLQHPPVYTLGMRARREHLLTSEATLRERGAEVVETDRGGDITFHGPGQLVAYPILDLRRRGLGPAEYVRMLEACVIEMLARFCIDANRVPGRPGAWVDRGAAKIAAIGVRIRDGVSMHGLALNVATDLEWFEAIVPCGIADAEVTSMARVLGRVPLHEAVEDVFIEVFARMFNEVAAEPELSFDGLKTSERPTTTAAAR
jgi:lipoyl(octanoyl) transferase